MGGIPAQDGAGGLSRELVAASPGRRGLGRYRCGMTAISDSHVRHRIDVADLRRPDDLPVGAPSNLVQIGGVAGFHPLASDLAAIAEWVKEESSHTNRLSTPRINVPATPQRRAANSRSSWSSPSSVAGRGGRAPSQSAAAGQSMRSIAQTTPATSPSLSEALLTRCLQSAFPRRDRKREIPNVPSSIASKIIPHSESVGIGWFVWGGGTTEALTV
jgi:hypothetical protein